MKISISIFHNEQFSMRKIFYSLLFLSLAICSCTNEDKVSSEDKFPVVPQAFWPEVPEVASYSIQVTLDTEAKTLTGHETITYHNTTSTPIPDIVLHLYLNAFRNKDSASMQKSTHPEHDAPENPGWIEITDIHLTDNTPLVLELLENGTLARADLPEEIPPSDNFTLEIDFKAMFPEKHSNTYFQEDSFMAGQWFPKLGVWQDRGWNAYAFYNDAEFFADFSSYDVAITLPSNYIIGNTGLPAGTLEQGHGTKTEIYSAKGVIDFAWAASPHFKQATREVDGIQVLYLYWPEHSNSVQRVLDAAEETVKHLSKWYGPYPYPRLTIVEPSPGMGGMEYPTLVTIGMFNLYSLNTVNGIIDRTLEALVMHEIGHQWWQSMVAFNEVEEPWLDEGFTEYSTARLMRQVYGHHNVLDFGLKISYLDVHRTLYLTTPRVPMYGKAGELNARYGDYGVSAYSKPMLALLTLENTLGEETMLNIMHTFFQKYQFSHPTTEDFLQVAEEASGQDLTWFFDGLVYGDDVVNYTVSAVNMHSITVERQGELIIPTEVEVNFSDGSTQLLPWEGQEIEKTWEFPNKIVTGAKVDPQRKNLLDLQWSDNGLSTHIQLWPGLAISTCLFYQIQNWLLYLGGL